MKRPSPILLAFVLVMACAAPAACPEPAPFACPECHAGFATRRKLRRHRCSALELAS